MCQMKLPIPTSLVNRSHLTRFHHGYIHCFTKEQLNEFFLLMKFCHLTHVLTIPSQSSARPNQVKKLAYSQQEIEAHILAVIHIFINA